MKHKWQFSARSVLNTRRKNPQPHAVIVTFRAVVPELWGKIISTLSTIPPCDVDSTVPEQVAEVIQRVVDEESGAQALGFHTNLPVQGAQFTYSNSVTGRVQFPLGTPPKKVRAFEAKLRKAVDTFFAESGAPYHQGELV